MEIAKIYRDNPTILKGAKHPFFKLNLLGLKPTADNGHKKLLNFN